MSGFRPDARDVAQRGRVLGGDSRRKLIRRQQREHCQRKPRADALDGLQQAEPVALDRRLEAVEMDMVFAHMGLDDERHRFADGRQGTQGAARAIDQIADATDVDHGRVLSCVGKAAAEARDHAALPASAEAQRPPVLAWWA